MKKINKTWVLIFILFILTIVLLGLSFLSINSTPQAKSSPTITLQAEKEVAFTTLQISNEPRISTVSGRYEVDVIMNTNQNKVTLTQLELSYDPDIMRVFDLKPTGLLQDAEIIQKNIDGKNGRISFWLGLNPGETFLQGEGSIATITFVKYGTESAEIDFAPKTSVNAKGSEKSVLLEALPGYIYDLPTKTPTPTRTFIPTPTGGI
jgi:hypothetical protein